MSLAVIKTGGKQYLVSPGQKVKIEKVDSPVGGEVEFSKVLLREKNGKLEIGNPIVAGAKVKGKVLETKKGKKVIVFRYKAKTRRQKKKGHRQYYSNVEILGIE